MTLQGITTMIQSIGIPSAYHHFSEATAKPTPFICYLYPDDSDFYADDTNYQSIKTLVIELYTDYTEFTLEEQIKAVLAENGLTWTREQDYIDSEKMYITTFTMEVVINGEQN